MGQQAEVIASLLEEQLNIPVHLNYLPGFGGGAAAAVLANSSADGYIMQFSPSLTYTFDPLTVPSGFGLESFDYLATVSRQQLALISSVGAPYSTWEELIDYAKEKGELIFASQAQSDHKLVRYIANQEGLDLKVVPTSGAAESLLLLQSGNVDVAFGAGGYLKDLRAGRVNVLLALDTMPLAIQPSAPTLVSAGYDIDFSSLRLFAVPAGTPGYRKEILQRAIGEVVSDPRFINVTEYELGMPVYYIYGGELEAILRDKTLSLRKIASL